MRSALAARSLRLGFLSLGLIGAAARANDVGGGPRVILTSPSALRAGWWPPADAAARIYTVERDRGGWLLVRSEGLSGWVRTSNVVPFDQALDHVNRKLQANPKSALDYQLRAALWAERGEFDRAIADATEALRLNPKLAGAHYIRGLARAGKGPGHEAFADFNEAIRLDPKDARPLLQRAKLWLVRRQFDKAVFDFTGVIWLDPRSAAQAHYGRGLAWAAQHAYDRAIADFGETIRLDPQHTLAYSSRGSPWLERGRAFLQKRAYAQAIADFTQALQLDPQSAEAYLSRGEAWQGQRAYSQAIADFVAAIRLDRQSPSGYNHLGWLWATCPDPQFRDGRRAVTAATRACERSQWRNSHHLATLAASHAEAGDFDAAVEWQQKAIGLWPKDDEDGLASSRARLKLYRAKRPYRDTPPTPSVNPSAVNPS
jgi:tetratricopeptide (TPR) repeat protein